MRRITLWLFGTVAAVVLLFSYRTSTAGGPATGGVLAAPVGRGVDGKLVHTRYGPVQVRITVTGGRITEIVLVAAPSGTARTDRINQTALPRLRERALAAQSADIDTVSGATYSSAGYRQSLQAAIDRAGL